MDSYSDDFYSYYGYNCSYFDYGYDDFTETSFVPTAERPPAVLFYTICCIIISCIGIPANSFLLWVLLKERAWKTTSKILPLQLTIANLGFAVFLPFEATHAHHDWVLGDWGCAVKAGAYLLWLYSYVWILNAMTLYRYVAVVHVLSTPKKMGVIMASIAIWLVCAAVSIRVSVNIGAMDHGFGEMCHRVPQSPTMTLFEVNMEIGLFFVLPFIIMLFCYIHMCVTIRQLRMISHHRASRLILGLIVVFVLCLAPHNVTWFIKYLVMFGVIEIPLSHSHHFLQNIHLHAIFRILLYLHCCLNPLIHIFGTQSFRRRLLPCKASSPRRDGRQNLSLTTVIPPHEVSV